MPQVRLSEPFTLVALDSVDSTNREAVRLAEAGAEEFTVVWALEQSAGRGRHGRTWVSPPGNLYCSVLLRPDFPAAQAMQLSFAAAISLADAIAGVLPQGAQGANVTCKWPNDVLVDGKKAAGVLLESASGGENLDWLVVGVGVNIAGYPEDTEFPATSLNAEGAENATPEALLKDFCESFHSSFVSWRDLGFAPLRAAWLKRASGLGEAVRVRLGQETVDGVFHDIDEDGALLLRHDGQERRITSGDVFLASG